MPHSQTQQLQQTKYYSFLTESNETYSRQAFVDHLTSLVEKHPGGLKVGNSLAVITPEHLSLLRQCILKVSPITAQVKDCVLVFLFLQYMMHPTAKEPELYEAAKCIQDQVVAWADGSISSLEQLKFYVQSLSSKRLETLVKVLELRILRIQQRRNKTQGILLNLGKNFPFVLNLQDTIIRRISSLPIVQTSSSHIHITIVSPDEAKVGSRKRKGDVDKSEERPTKRHKKHSSDSAIMMTPEFITDLPDDYLSLHAEESSSLESAVSSCDMIEAMFYTEGIDTELDLLFASEEILNMFSQ